MVSQRLRIDDACRTRFREDGVVCLRNALLPDAVATARAAFDWSISHPGPGAAYLPANGTGRFYQDLANPAAFAAYASLIHGTPVGDIVAALWGASDVWFMYEQVFVKSSGTTRRTPWHQDTSYLPVRGADLAVLWMSFEPVAQANALEFVPGSHRATLYDGSRFDPADDTAPLYGDGTLPRLPDIERERDRWRVVSWATAPGDIIVFHPGLLHGGAPTPAEFARHSLSLRFFGPDAVVAARPQRRIEAGAAATDPAVHPLTRMRALADGAPFRDDGFPKIRLRGVLSEVQ